MTENPKLTGAGSEYPGDRGSGTTLATCASSLIVVIAWTSQACAAGSVPGQLLHRGGQVRARQGCRAELETARKLANSQTDQVGGGRGQIEGRRRAGGWQLGRRGDGRHGKKLLHGPDERANARGNVTGLLRGLAGGAPGTTGWVNGGSHCAFPVTEKKLVHCASVTCFSVATVGCGVDGDVVDGSQAAIWSASVLGVMMNVMDEPG